jgi:hypothetical protein
MIPYTMSEREAIHRAQALYQAAAARREAGAALDAAGRLALLVTETAAAAALALSRSGAGAPAERFGGYPRIDGPEGPTRSEIRPVDIGPGASSPLIAAAQSAGRSGFILRNLGPGVALVAYSAKATAALHSFSLQPGADHIDPTGWAGPVSATSESGPARILITELLR